VISYGTYIWQAPLFGILDATGHRLAGMQGLVLAVVLGVLSYFLVERRFLRLKARLSRQPAPSEGIARTDMRGVLANDVGPRAVKDPAGMSGPTHAVTLDADESGR
jgi:peptidoglycan/LPS O-acetylase OafA/YrhL